MKRTRPTIAGLSLLGRSEAALPASPADARLEVFPNPQPKRGYWIHLDCPDFTSLCPVTGQPDFARITIDYIPGQKCLETKALKFYLAAFRNEPAFNEAVINRILDDLVRACRPKVMRVEGKFSPRGGLGLAVVAEHPRPGAAATAPKFWRGK
ncbi:MAG TPA: preQ(1) synthase [Opitutales bacterium]|nr:preQ(1) synthase [Opitutales bacterium]